MSNARFVRNFDEFRKWLAEHYAPCWETASEKEVRFVFGNHEFPARVWQVELRGDWGPTNYGVRSMTEDQFYCRTKSTVGKKTV